MAFEMDFASEIPLSAIKSMICRRFSLFRFRFSVFIVVLSDKCKAHCFKKVWVLKLYHLISIHPSYVLVK